MFGKGKSSKNKSANDQFIMLKARQNGNIKPPKADMTPKSKIQKVKPVEYKVSARQKLGAAGALKRTLK